MTSSWDSTSGAGPSAAVPREDPTEEFYLGRDPDVPRPAGHAREAASGPLRDGTVVTVTGSVAGRVERTEQQQVRYPDGHWGETSVSVVSFRLESFDSAGNRAQTVPVEMRGAAFIGTLTDGDQVTGRGRISSGVVSCTELQHTDSGAVFRVTRSDTAQQAAQPGKVIALVLACVILVPIFAVLAASLFHFRLPFGIGDPESGGSSSTQTVRMPDVVGEDNVNAAQLLEQAGITNFLMEDQKAPASKFGKVVRTTPEAGKVVRQGTTVRIYLGVVR